MLRSAIYDAVADDIGRAQSPGGELPERRLHGLAVVCHLRADAIDDRAKDSLFFCLVNLEKGVLEGGRAAIDGQDTHTPKVNASRRSRTNRHHVLSRSLRAQPLSPPSNAK